MVIRADAPVFLFPWQHQLVHQKGMNVTGTLLPVGLPIGSISWACTLNCQGEGALAAGAPALVPLTSYHLRKEGGNIELQ